MEPGKRCPEAGLVVTVVKVDDLMKRDDMVLAGRLNRARDRLVHHQDSMGSGGE